MAGMVSNIAVFVLCVPICVLAFRKSGGREWRSALFLILVAGLILRMYAASDRCLHTWDERYHALVAKNAILHPLTPTLFEDPVLPYDFKDWTSNHIWLEKGPVPLLAVSGSIRLFGTDELAVRVPSVLVSLLSVYLTYLIASLLFDRETGILAAFFHSINGLLIELPAGRVSSDHVDTFFIFFIELGIYLSILYLIGNRRWYIPLLIGLLSRMAERVTFVLIPPLGLIFLVLGTIFLGVATPTEGGAMGAVGALAMALARRRMDLKLLRQAMAGVRPISENYVTSLEARKGGTGIRVHTEAAKGPR